MRKPAKRERGSPVRSFFGCLAFLGLPCGPGTSALKLRLSLRGVRGKRFKSVAGGGDPGIERGAGLVAEDGLVTSLTIASTAARSAGSDSPLIPADCSSLRYSSGNLFTYKFGEQTKKRSIQW